MGVLYVCDVQGCEQKHEARGELGPMGIPPGWRRVLMPYQIQPEEKELPRAKLLPGPATRMMHQHRMGMNPIRSLLICGDPEHPFPEFKEQGQDEDDELFDLV